jgi:hypothetical protein
MEKDCSVSDSPSFSSKSAGAGAKVCAASSGGEGRRRPRLSNREKNGAELDSREKKC